MRIQVLSDVHLEVAKNPIKLIEKILPSCPEPDTVLVLAGDIGHFGSELYMEYIERASRNYRAIFLVLGNHEYYCSSVEKISQEILQVKLPDNVHLLERASIVLDNVRFIGCTLWAVGDPDLIENINDFRYIQDMTPELYANLNKIDKNWLKNELNNTGNFKTVVITHHMPSKSLINRVYKNNPLNVFYANELDDLVKHADFWLCGHTHIPNTVDIGKCRCITNPVGYTGENPKCNFQSRIDL